jgi:hypothetical protein
MLVETVISATHGPGNEHTHGVGEMVVVRETDRQFGEEFDRLWEEVARSLTVAVERRKEYLNWRYANPCASYHILRADVDGRLRGFLVFVYQNRKALRTVRVLDLLFASPEVGTRLVEACISRAKEDKAHVLKLYKNRLTKDLSGSLGLVEAWIPNHIVARIGASDLQEIILDISNWFLTGADIEDAT